MNIDQPDVILIGSGIMSATLGTMLKRLDSAIRIQLYEVSAELTRESSNAWNNAGTGHAGLCELSYTPDRLPDGTVDVQHAIEIFDQFEQSRQFWANLVETNVIASPRDFVNPVPHVSFVHGQSQVDFLAARHRALVQHHFFSKMKFSADNDEIKSWAPLLIDGRAPGPVAATRVMDGTDVNFGELSRKMIRWLSEQPGCGVATAHRVTDLQYRGKKWNLKIRDAKQNQTIQNSAAFVFIGAGGGSLPLLQKSGIPESKGFGGFPIGGQWMVCDNPSIVSRHQAKVYGQAQEEAPTMAVPHLDTRVIDGKKSLLFGPFAAWTTRFLKEEGRLTDLPFSIKFDNMSPLLRVGAHNLPLVKYLVQQGLQSMASRLKLLRTFYPEVQATDWRLIEAGIRVQAIKRTDGIAGIVHYGTEIVTDQSKTIAALLGASPGASVSVSLMLQLIKDCLPKLLQTPEGKDAMMRMIPTYDFSLAPNDQASTFESLHEHSNRVLQLTN